MLDNIWRGLLVNYHFLLQHQLEVAATLLVLMLIFLIMLFGKIRDQQEISYQELLEQQTQIEHIQYRLIRLNRICQENHDKQRFITNQLSRVDDSIFELEEIISTLKHSLQNQPLLKNTRTVESYE